ncbi:uncharacterized protein METZ01_LOCUS516373, partial [marine metagenome]
FSGLEDEGCGCGEAGPSGCDNACGSTAEVDECGECGGDSSSCDEGCGPNQPGPSGCDDTCGSTLENDECGVCGGDNSSCADCAGVPNGDSALDDCGECDGSNDCLNMGWFVATGGLNEVALQWEGNANAVAYNISRDGENIFTMPQGYGEAWIDDGFNGSSPNQGLGFDIEYCYSITAVSASGNGGVSADACATTLPQLQAFLDLDLSLANADVAAVASPFGDLTGDG